MELVTALQEFVRRQRAAATLPYVVPAFPVQIRDAKVYHDDGRGGEDEDQKDEDEEAEEDRDTSVKRLVLETFKDVGEEPSDPAVPAFLPRFPPEYTYRGLGRSEVATDAETSDDPRAVTLRVTQETDAVVAQMALKSRIANARAAGAAERGTRADGAPEEGGRGGLREQEMARLAAQARAVRNNYHVDSNPFLRPATMEDSATYALPPSILEALCGNKSGVSGFARTGFGTADDDLPAPLTRNASVLGWQPPQETQAMDVQHREGEALLKRSAHHSEFMQKNTNTGT